MQSISFLMIALLVLTHVSVAGSDNEDGQTQVEIVMRNYYTALKNGEKLPQKTDNYPAQLICFLHGGHRPFS